MASFFLLNQYNDIFVLIPNLGDANLLTENTPFVFETANAFIASGPIDTFTLDNVGVDFVIGDVGTVLKEYPGGVDATYEVDTVGVQDIVSSVLNDAGVGWVAGDAFTVNAGNADAVGIIDTISALGNVVAVAVNNPGVDYVPGDIIYIDSGNVDSYWAVDTVDGFGAVLTLILSSFGTSYTTGTGYATLLDGLGPGTGLTLDIVTVGGGVDTYHFTNPGSGYIVATGVSIDNAGDAGALINILNVNPVGAILTMHITDPGDGYFPSGFSLGPTSGLGTFAHIAVNTITSELTDSTVRVTLLYYEVEIA
jgi:hypothetical protein